MACYQGRGGGRNSCDSGSRAALICMDSGDAGMDLLAEPVQLLADRHFDAAPHSASKGATRHSPPSREGPRLRLPQVAAQVRQAIELLLRRAVPSQKVARNDGRIRSFTAPQGPRSQVSISGPMLSAAMAALCARRPPSLRRRRRAPKQRVRIFDSRCRQCIHFAYFACAAQFRCNHPECTGVIFWRNPMGLCCIFFTVDRCAFGAAWTLACTCSHANTDYHGLCQHSSMQALD